jgi:hypothetical protein
MDSEDKTSENSVTTSEEDFTNINITIGKGSAINNDKDGKKFSKKNDSKVIIDEIQKKILNKQIT